MLRFTCDSVGMCLPSTYLKPTYLPFNFLVLGFSPTCGSCLWACACPFSELYTCFQGSFWLIVYVVSPRAT